MRRVEIPWAYSCEMTLLSKDPSRVAGPPASGATRDTTSPVPMATRIRSHSTLLINTEGMVTSPAFSPAPIGMVTSSKLQMIAPIAPASWALYTLRLKSHTPRSMRAIFPASSGCWVTGLQPCVGSKLPSLISMTCPVTGNVVISAPNSGSPVRIFPPRSAGSMTSRYLLLLSRSQINIRIVPLKPSGGVLKSELFLHSTSPLAWAPQLNGSLAPN